VALRVELRRSARRHLGLHLMTERPPNLPRCLCGKALNWYARAQCWLCPVVEKEPLAGLLHPLESLQVRREGSIQAVTSVTAPFTTMAVSHVTCLPAELYDEELPPPTPAIDYARGLRSDIGRPEAPPTTADGRRTITDERGVPLSGIQAEKWKTYQCDECGVRTPSADAMRGHCKRTGHSGGETLRGNRVEAA
jgi:hypothetical protein